MMPTAATVAPVQLDEARFGYGEHPATGPISFEIRPGEVVALLGANGSGKSTVVKGILGLIGQFGGSVKLFGDPAEDLRDRDRIGYVPQRHSLSGVLPCTTSEVVASGLLSRRSWFGRQTREDRAAAADAIERCGLAGLGSRRVGELSGGQQRRVLVARAIAARPPLLFLDEPTAGVDAEQQLMLATTLEGLAADGTTILFVTHELGPFERLFTRAIVMDRGEVVYDGAPLPAHRHHDCGGETHEHGEASERPSGLVDWQV